MALDNDPATQFADSDSEGESDRTSKTPVTVLSDTMDTAQYKKALMFKGAKGSNSGLYYVNYNTAKGGDGLNRDEKNQLASDVANADANFSALQHSLNIIVATTKTLHTEPFNNALNGLLENAETQSLELSAQLDMANTFKQNEKHKQETIKCINYYSSCWRKRRKICMDFLIGMEELTEGTVTVKACLRGNGPIDIDSDEEIIKLALDFAKKKQNRTFTSKGAMSGCNRSNKSNLMKSGLHASDDFVAVTLDAQGNIQRIYTNDENVSA